MQFHDTFCDPLSEVCQHLGELEPSTLNFIPLLICLYTSKCLGDDNNQSERKIFMPTFESLIVLSMFFGIDSIYLIEILNYIVRYYSIWTTYPEVFEVVD